MNGEAIRGGTYRVVVRGELDERFGSLFEGLRMECGDGRTVATGPVRDQAHLYGLLARIQELGLELIAVQRVDGTG
jgi:hypothetical protein